MYNLSAAESTQQQAQSGASLGGHTFNFGGSPVGGNSWMMWAALAVAAVVVYKVVKK